MHFTLPLPPMSGGIPAALSPSAIWRRLRDNRRRLARIRATHEALGALDAHLLHDLGLDRSEIGSVAVEIADLGTPQQVERLITRRSFPNHL